MPVDEPLFGVTCLYPMPHGLEYLIFPVDWSMLMADSTFGYMPTVDAFAATLANVHHPPSGYRSRLTDDLFGTCFNTSSYVVVSHPSVYVAFVLYFFQVGVAAKNCRATPFMPISPLVTFRATPPHPNSGI